MLTIKAYNDKSFKDFYEQILKVGTSNNIKTNVIFDEIFVEDIRISFFNNLSILFSKDLKYLSEKITKNFDILLDKTLYIGVDEVGVGENIGPFVVCAVKFENLSKKKETLLLGIKDSKKLRYEQIQKLAPLILKNVTHKVIMLEPEEFNKKWLEIKNVKKINALIQKQLIDSLYEENYVPIIDEFVSRNKFIEYLNNADIRNITFVQKAEDKYLEVACASIIAKYIYNKWLVDFLKQNEIPFKIEKKLDANGIYSSIKTNKINVNKDKLFKEWAKDKV